MYSINRLKLIFDKITKIDSRTGARNVKIIPKKLKERFRIYEDLLNIRLEQPLTILVGSKGSGVEEYMKQFEETETLLTISSSTFANNMNYASIKGSAPGYIGSENPTAFAQSLSEEDKEYVVFVKGVDGVDRTCFEDFISSFIQGKFVESTGKIGEIDVSRHKLVIFVAESLDRELLPEELFERLLKKEAVSDASRKTHPIFDRSQLEKFDIRQVREFRKDINLVDKISKYRKVKDIDLLKEAIYEFNLENREVLDIAEKDLDLTFSEDECKLLIDGHARKEKRIISEATYAKFLKKLENYYSQEDAIMVFKQALAHKISDNSPRPVSIFCAGPPGVGKTYLSNLLGEAVGSFVRVDANIVTSIEDIFGNSPFLRKINANSANVILIDEVEKMPKHVLLAFLQLLDEGRLVNPVTGDVYELSDSIIVFTSNAISEKMSEEESRNALREFGFPREFIDRLNYVATFRSFSPKETIELAQKMKGRKLSDYEKSKLSDVRSLRRLKVELDKLESIEKAAQLDMKLSQHKKSYSR